MSTYRASYLVEKQGKLEIRERKPLPTPKPHQILVKIYSASVNPVDYLIQSIGFIVEEYPHILGNDAAGVVEEVGSEVTNFKKGDRVFYQASWMHKEATFQEYGVTDAALVAKIPDNLDFDQAATIPLASQTALGSIFNDGGVPFPTNGPTAEGKPILITSGAGSVGGYGIQLARIAGFSPIITTASLSNTEQLKKTGATHVLDRNAKDLASQVREIAPTLSLVFDAAGIEATQKLALEAIDPAAKDGRLVSVGEIGEAVADLAAKRQNPVKANMTWGEAHNFRHVSIPFWQSIEGWLAKGVFVPNKVQVMGGLKDLQAAFDYGMSGKVKAVKMIIHVQE